MQPRKSRKVLDIGALRGIERIALSGQIAAPADVITGRERRVHFALPGDDFLYRVARKQDTLRAVKMARIDTVASEAISGKIKPQESEFVLPAHLPEAVGEAAGKDDIVFKKQVTAFFVALLERRA